MGNGKLDPRSLNAEERAIVLDWFLMGRSRTFEDAFRLTERTIIAYREFFGQPASEGGKVECPNCGGEAAYFDEHHDGYEFLCAPCKPAQPEHLFTCRNCGKGYDCDEGEHYIFASGLYACLPPKPAQPEPVAAEMPEAVGMTPELRRLLEFAENNVENRCGEIRHEMPRVIAAVRAQAASAQPKAVPVEALIRFHGGVASANDREAIDRWLAQVEGE